LVKEEETIKEQNRLFEQKPVALWKWILGLLLLLALPISVLFDQIIFSFQETRRQKVYELELELEKLAARAVLEQSNLVQLRETFKEFISAVEKPIQKHFFYRFVPVPVSPLPFVKVSDFNRLLRIPHYVKFKRIEQNLRKFIPGLKLIQWNHNYQLNFPSRNY
jgi:hypothetical protein